MDNVDRMYRHLVRTIRSRFPQYLVQPFEVAELHQTILPYRHHRRELGIATNDDYEITLTELLSGARDYLVVDERMRDVLRAELASANPDPTAFKQFANATVALSPASLRSLEAGPTDESLPTRVTGAKAASASAESRTPTVPRVSGSPSVGSTPPTMPGLATSLSTVTSGSPANVARPIGASSATGIGSMVPQSDEKCPACDETLPPGRAITFCPHCGQNVTIMNCPACGSELDVGWKFCPTCGRPATAL